MKSFSEVTIKNIIFSSCIFSVKEELTAGKHEIFPLLFYEFVVQIIQITNHVLVRCNHHDFNFSFILITFHTEI